MERIQGDEHFRDLGRFWNFPQVFRVWLMLKSMGGGVSDRVGIWWKNVGMVIFPIFTDLKNPQGEECRK